MLNEELNQGSPNAVRDRSRMYRISLDLGSDSTVAFVGVPGQTEYTQIELQFFLRALATVPDLLRDRYDRPSHRLKSRYAVNMLFQSAEPISSREHPRYGYLEVLPEGHARTPLIDFEQYVREARSSGSKADMARNSSKCFFKFIDDISAPFPSSALLPNAKLIFQSGVGLEKHYEVLAEGRTDWVKLHPVEIIKNQVCLILENFIRPHPDLRDELNRMPSWSDCVVVLTVPNTYSPFHREVLAESVKQTLGCEVETITESDAVVFYYIAKVQPDTGLSGVEMQGMEQKYLTIDIGKGTTDLTLMAVTHKDASDAEKRSRGLDPSSKAIMKHVYVDARTGRASGGAKMTFILARFFERLIDFNLRKTLDSFTTLSPEETGRLADLARSPLRLTTRSTAQIPQDSAQSRRLLEFEGVSDWYKRELDLSAEGVIFPDLGSKSETGEIADYIAQVTLDQASAIHDVMLTLGQKAQIRTAVVEALETPSKVRSIQVGGKTKALAATGKGRGHAPVDPYAAVLDGIWSDLEKDIHAYVHENIDEVLVELAQAHVHGNDNVEFDDAAQALSFMMGSKTNMKGSDGFRPKHVRTHLIVAGQGSQFKPLRNRLSKLLRDSGFGAIYTEQQLKELGNANAKAAKALAKPKTSFLNKIKEFARDREGDEIPSAIEHLAVELSGPNLKDGCAYGALDWYSSNPVMQNPDAIHGQLIVTLSGGGDPYAVDMDELNSNKRVEVQRSIFDAQVVYYLPSKGYRVDMQKKPGGSIMGTLMSCNQLVIEVRPPKTTSHLMVSTSSGQTIKLKESIYGAEDAKDLREMLWPAMLLDE
jgi:hypothetical protein